jgi:amidase
LQVGATEGVIARSVRDLRLGLAALERPDRRDPWQAPAAAPRADDDVPCRAAFFTGESEFGADAEIATTVRKAAAWLEEAGYVVEEAEPPALAEITELWMAMLYAECTGATREFLLKTGDEAFRRSFENTAANFPELDYQGFHSAWQRRLAIQREWVAFLEKYPVLLMPTSFRPTFPIDHDVRGKREVAEIVNALVPSIAVAGVALPGLSVPVGTAAGTPAGVQVVCGRFDDERCLSTAAVLEEQIGKVLPMDPVGA